MPGQTSGYKINFVLGADEELLRKSINSLLALLTLIDRYYLQHHPELPPLYQSGIRYLDECGSNDHWQDVPTTYALRTGDCEDFAAIRAAELQVRHGIQAWPHTLMRKTPEGRIAFHTVVRYPSGQIEDPAVRLGLRGSDEHSCTGLGAGVHENKIRFLIDLFEGHKELWLSHKVLSLMLHALCVIDMRYLLKYPSTPRLYDAGVRYEYEPDGREDWQDVPTNILRTEADCEDLACHRAAELRVFEGVKAWPRFTSKLRPNGSFLFHIIVCKKNPQGLYISDRDDPRYDPHYIEDPSRVLGMKG